jgi:hypothetical protein
MTESDRRVAWFGDRIAIGLDVTPEFVQDFVNRNDAEGAATLKAFAEGTGPSTLIFVLAQAGIDREVQCFADHVPEGAEGTTVILLRNSAPPVNPASESFEEDMARAFDLDVMDDSPLADLGSLVQDIFSPILSGTVAPPLGFSTVQSSAGPGLAAAAAAAAADDEEDAGAAAAPADTAAPGGSNDTSRVSDSLRQEFASRTSLVCFPYDSHEVLYCAELKKYGRQLSSAVQQLKGDVRLRVPDIVIADPAAVVDDLDVRFDPSTRVGCLTNRFCCPQLVNEVEAAVDEWTPQLQQIVEAQLAVTPVGKVCVSGGLTPNPSDPRPGAPAGDRVLA